MRTKYDIIVIGGGHAGAEAAWAASRLGADTALVTMKIEAIGRMSCNPAIGGVGKGQMVREIDALGGLMGLAIDATGIQFRMLNRSKGQAVWSPRAQADRDLYAREVRRLLETCRGLDFVEGLVEDIVVRQGRVAGVELAGGQTLHAPLVIITTGTFMQALMHCGERQREGGRVGEQAAAGMSATLANLGFELGRFKTGTPPRVHRDTVDFDVLERQPGEDPPTPFSFVTDEISQPQIDCWITYTTAEGHDLIRANLHRSAMYSGQIKATGVRYCPSIEDKVVRFADKPRHQVFLEPEGRDSEWIYLNGLGTSLPPDVQESFLHTIDGLKRARILQWGYAVEYDYVPTIQTKYSLESKRVAGLFLAGQINGTSGYEEAAGQGLIAGINAVQRLRNEPPCVLRRDQAYIGVMIDDLIARPPDEPYRMFTSRAEYRLLLRNDNADQRLTPVAREIGLVDEQRWQRFETKTRRIAQAEAVLRDIRHNGRALIDVLRRPGARWSDVEEMLPVDSRIDLDPQAQEQVLIRAKYHGYLERMHREAERLKKMEEWKIPQEIKFAGIAGLRNEAREKLSAIQPRTLGQASRISGVTPADITTLWIELQKAG
ncbi:MAG: tRNA uridine-5-carboxymethylaminomethyl(34) synthesis enzyme MnmG [Planctomycetota bacterium]|nr:tRNA uridine-5-carboxymethylaminomethyl(34) synthesis enzyme MnmG [Planctomycetota bacterium]